MKNIKRIAVLGLIFLLSTTVFGQPKKGNKPNQEKIKAMKIGFITEKLNLTTQEAQKFWPVYNEFENKMDKFRKQRREDHKKYMSILEKNDAEIEKMVDNYIIIQQKELDVKKEYHAKFKTVLPIKKVAQLYIANEQFKRELLKRIKNHQHKNIPK